ncbi:MAG: DNA (cytosine-5-)-methyltransferase [Flavobacterium sp. MedPE-SWcel]|uniref:DNA cytosine methyltransferase n=1 Tax=uncultured Flavobacterium sp. TaxID=165435 RepID=UPI00091A6353|nr:DNA cytosine methyltransferase [uncultured Flavobacterium sp.]OIQ22053.1 MAG: DNA (cytosine-5-)-methyltransferase [Flavobacterium sp. MedPE-SWcel]
MKLKAIDLFSGAGGMSVGASMVGIEVVVAVESDSHAAESFKANHANAEIIQNDIREISLDPKYKDLFILFGGPPCQGFSISNTKTRNSENKNNSLFHEFIRQVDEMNPKWFVFENVEGITTFEKGTIVAKLEKKFEKLGYKTSWKVLTASDYGVPQNRNRFFMVGNRLGIDFSFPDKEEEVITVKEAIKDLPKLENGANHDLLNYKKVKITPYIKLMRGNSKKPSQNYVSKNQPYVIERYKHIKPGQNWKAIPVELMTNYKNTSNCHSGIYKRLDPKKPSVVIANYRKNMLIHPYEHRGLSVREAARIQSFPDNFMFKGNLSFQQQQIGNAVPPLLAKAIFKQIIESYKTSKK